jgi:hypothetical protein
MTMNRVWKGLLVATALSLGATSSLSAPIVDVWTDPAGDVLLDLDNNPLPGVTSYSYVHDITDDGFSIGDTILSATMFVSLRDEGGSETYQYEIGLGGGQINVFSNVPNARIDEIPFLQLSLDDLQLDGIIEVTLRITADSNNQEGLYFVSSRLEVTLDENGAPPAQIPEPGSAFLLGLGLAGLGWRYRRERRRKSSS